MYFREESNLISKATTVNISKLTQITVFNQSTPCGNISLQIYHFLKIFIFNYVFTFMSECGSVQVTSEA